MFLSQTNKQILTEVNLISKMLIDYLIGFCYVCKCSIYYYAWPNGAVCDAKCIHCDSTCVSGYIKQQNAECMQQIRLS